MAAWCGLALLALAGCSLNEGGTGPSDKDVDMEPAESSDASLDARSDARRPPQRDDGMVADPDVDAAEPHADAAPRDGASDDGGRGDVGDDAAIVDAGKPDARIDGGPRDAGDASAPDAGHCSLPGKYATLVDLDVTWGYTVLGGVLPVLQPGAGTIRLYATVELGANQQATVAPCGTTVPDFEGTPGVGSELYGGDIPNAAWDAPTMPRWIRNWGAECNQPGCKLMGDEFELVIGAEPTEDDATWPLPGEWGLSPFEAVDHDSDGRPGITMITRGPPRVGPDGRVYSYPPVGLASFARARKLLIALFMRMTLEGTLDTCDRITGTLPSAAVHASAVSCTGVPDGETSELLCSEDVAQFVDSNLPRWTVQGATFTMVRLPAGSGCYTARAILQ